MILFDSLDKDTQRLLDRQALVDSERLVADAQRMGLSVVDLFHQRRDGQLEMFLSHYDKVADLVSNMVGIHLHHVRPE